MSPGLVALIMFGSLLVLILLRVPISFALAFSVVPILLFTPRVTPIMLLQRMMVQYGNFILLAVPFFLLAANIMNKSGITDRLLRFSRSLVGPLPGGLAHVNVFVSMLFAGISGSSNADAAGVGGVLIPAMEKEGYDKRFSVAVTSCSAVMGNIIPPSINMVIWGGIMSVSIGGLFMAGIIPGIMIAVFQMALVLGFAYRRKYQTITVFKLKEVLLSFRDSILGLLTPVFIVGGIVGGIVTPTEASMIAVVYSIIIAVFMYRSMGLKQVTDMFLETARLASIVLFAVGTASIYAWVLAYYNLPKYLVEFLGVITTDPTLMLFIFVAIWIFVGTFMDAVPAMIVVGPLLLPVADFVGLHPLHFGVVSVMALVFGLVTPPYGLTLLIASEIAGINATRSLKEVGIFLIAMLIVLSLIVIFPELTLWIPRMVMPNLF